MDGVWGTRGNSCLESIEDRWKGRVFAGREGNKRHVGDGGVGEPLGEVEGMTKGRWLLRIGVLFSTRW